MVTPWLIGCALGLRLTKRTSLIDAPARAISSSGQLCRPCAAELGIHSRRRIGDWGVDRVIMLIVRFARATGLSRAWLREQICW